MRRFVILSIETENEKLTQIHALEMINNEMTGIYFHAYFKKVCDYMYYLSDCETTKDDYIENFKKFVGDSTIITADELNNIFDDIFKNKKVIYIKKNYQELMNYYKINNNHGIVKCTLLGRYIIDKKLIKFN